ncbi:MAG TPA: cytochrome c, partial [Thermoanaerobaculia bacterium]|nr:cytochrome c [Thermoanaerobaculia bacterium]
LLDYGCTVCHRGRDRATHFARAGHMPRDEEQREKWEAKWSWEEQHYLETPMYPGQYSQAACIRCHGEQITIPAGDRITEATHMVELYGCHSCHKIATWRFENLRKPGPDLRGLAEKTTPQWVWRWIAAPHEFRSTTRMPAFFYLRNVVGPEIEPDQRAHNIRLQDAEIHAIVRFLFTRSTRRQWPAGPSGDAASGERLVQNLGCLGCHVMQDEVEGQDGVSRPARRDDFPLERQYGFNLVGTGTKSKPAWLFNWLKDPRAYYHDAPMPDLRLTDQEAADITAFLMTLRKPEFMQAPVRAVDPKAVRELARTYLITGMTERQTDARLDRMTLEDQLVFMGERSIEKYGCYSCHTIEGFEDLKPIGTELTTEGSKSLHLFDFGFVHDYEAHDGKAEHIIHTTSSWIYNKLREPRVYDLHREKGYQDKLKMPNFHLSEREAELISSVVLGLTKERIAESKMAAADARSRAVQEGRKMVAQHNCRGCHLVEGRGGAIAQTIEDSGMLPPDLGPEGARVQSDFLFNFLKDPTVMSLRPWLTVRMPTFHFSDEEASRLVEHWAADAALPAFETQEWIEPPSRSVQIGGIVFDMLRCAQCHPSGPVDVAATEDLASLAPDLSYARARLRHEWIPDWIRRPNEIVPGTRMPTNFPRDNATGGFKSPLPLAIDSPAFANHRARLLQHYGSEQELRLALEDVVTISGHLRDYIWSIGSPEMRKARPTALPEVIPLPLTPQVPTPELVPATQATGQKDSISGLAPGGR